MNRYKIVLACVALLTMALITSCDKDKDICDENKVCYTDQPDSLYVKLKLPDDLGSDSVEISFYKGYFDTGEKIDQFYTSQKEIYYLMPVNERYSASARYIDGNDTIAVIDGDKLEDGSYTNCDKSCYDWDDEMELDLRIDK